MHRTRSLVSAALILAAAVTTLGCSSKDKGGPTGTTTRELDSGNLGGGAVYSHRFFAPGNFPYHCTIHSFMNGAVVVSGSAPVGDSLGTVIITGSAFVTSTVTIPINGKVTWTNNDGITHTVTSN